jgi:hypothetical protein
MSVGCFLVGCIGIIQEQSCCTRGITAQERTPGYKDDLNGSE